MSALFHLNVDLLKHNFEMPHRPTYFKFKILFLFIFQTIDVKH